MLLPQVVFAYFLRHPTPPLLAICPPTPHPPPGLQSSIAREHSIAETNTRESEYGGAHQQEEDLVKFVWCKS